MGLVHRSTQEPLSDCALLEWQRPKSRRPVCHSGDSKGHSEQNKINFFERARRSIDAKLSTGHDKGDLYEATYPGQLNVDKEPDR